MSAETAGILRTARDLIATPGTWTKGELARDEDGCPVFPWSDDAVCFCAVGAIKRATGRFQYLAEDEAIRALTEAIPHVFVPDFNDASAHSDVLAAFDRAIASEESKP